MEAKDVSLMIASISLVGTRYTYKLRQQSCETTVDETSNIRKEKKYLVDNAAT